MNKTIEELAAFIADEISYDGEVLSPQVTCPKCGEVVEEESRRVWIHHRSSFITNIERFLGIHVREVLTPIIEDAWLEGSREEDSIRLAKEIHAAVYF